MNHKFLLIFSILIIGVGIAGLIVDKKSDEIIVDKNSETITDKKISIVVAQAIDDLSPGTLLNHKKYIFSNMTVPNSSSLTQYDLSDIKSIDGYLIKNTVKKEAYITKNMIESPDSPDFIRLNLQPGEIIYKFNIDKKNEYLIDSLNSGDLLSLQLRTLEVDDKKGKANGILLESNTMSSNKKQNYAITNIIPDMMIINIKKYSDEELGKVNNSKSTEYSIGYINVRIKSRDVETIYAVEKTGDIFLTPTDGIMGESGTEKNLYNIIPRLKTARELRG